ncbi:rubrerythrin family protein [Dethiobacter alkaliphilus]|uniref:rubrerythrin family protein n=1 Tax=Dethiobacter alkaliphilus TaxID=427926 RepID=UPI002225B9C2|nr:rubrerythrin family protein [Dethiobacter alkaliphilus]MCW3488552.1 rubrerythrin family protein [Dethiobacter alkaliphilus]
MKTLENLMNAFAGESQANRKYLAFAIKAEKEGYNNIGRIFRAIAEAETIHALKHLEVAGKVGSTLENLEEAVQGEHYEYSTMYPEFIETAKEEDQPKALKSFEYANEAEKVHGKTFSTLKEEVSGGQDIADQQVSLCPVCGWVGLGAPPERCPICNTPANKFKEY